MNFLHYSPTRLVVGRGNIAETGAQARSLGTKAFVICGASSCRNGALTRLLESLSKHNVVPFSYEKPAGEPTVDMTNAAADEAREAQCDLVVSLGGGAVIDLAKAVSGLVTNGGRVEDYLEGVGTGCEVTRNALPHVAIPTTAGAGAEVTRNAVISSTKKHFKKSFRHPSLYPAIAILDAKLTLSLPPHQTAYSGMDSITQLIEAYLTPRATPMTDALAIQGLKLALPSIRRVFHNGSDIEARENMLLASTLSGICLANAGLGLAHGFASGLGALYDVPHGKACAILLPHAMRINKDVSGVKLAEVGRQFCGFESLPQTEACHLALQEIENLNREFSIPPDLKSFHISPDDYDRLIDLSMGNSMSGNPVEITKSLAREILHTLT